ncbi:flagellar biosynthetic protein FliO [Rhizobium sp. CFBP 8762]|uniref:flagellar biosynthetic protein FliO n=1 Tax=Rhizobium sp. CFBP 8762 TaxID=2775279 RepID=UPI00177AE645|nr:flagellar biosynthetic protein FliO [Rhizobium sp. CFBP 8762]MBD8555815.1 flagellar biosynthetic protein FliO [Rhizobium sp. CFBP 8762]
MFETIASVNGSRLLLAVAAVAIGLVVLVLILKVFKNRPSSPFIRGGKNRQPRLAVLDAAAVDARRRIVLVRRDNVEHLILIGGPTDLVIESGIAGNSGVEAAALQPPMPAQAAPSRKAEAAVVDVPKTAAAARDPRPKAALQPSPTKPVSAAGQTLYGADDTVAPVRPTPAARTAPPVAPVQAQVPKPISATLDAEDILDAARSRVLTKPVQAKTAASVAQPTRREPVSDFERVLDAEVSANLEQQPSCTVPPIKTGPTLEEEMARMLGDIAPGKKP